MLLLTGESSTEPTELIFVLKRNSSPIFRRISAEVNCGEYSERAHNVEEEEEEKGGRVVGNDISNKEKGGVAKASNWEIPIIAEMAEKDRTGWIGEPLCDISILPVSLMISGMSFVSSIVDEINSSNCASGKRR